MHLCAPRGEGPHQVRGLGGDVEAGADPDTREGLLALEPLADQAQDGHLPLGPLDAAHALVDKREVGHIVRDMGGGVGHVSSWGLAGSSPAGSAGV